MHWLLSYMDKKRCASLLDAFTVTTMSTIDTYNGSYIFKRRKTCGWKVGGWISINTTYESFSTNCRSIRTSPYPFCVICYSTKCDKQPTPSNSHIARRQKDNMPKPILQEEDRCWFSPTPHKHMMELECIQAWVNMKRREHVWVNVLIGLFYIEWKTPCHDLLMQFLNTWKITVDDLIFAQM